MMLIAIPAAAGNVYGLDGSGTKEDPFIMAKDVDFYALCENSTLIGQNFSGKSIYFKQTADIDVSEMLQQHTNTDFHGIGSCYDAIVYYDGGGHSISGFWGFSAYDYVGFVGHMVGGEIHDLTFINPVMDSGTIGSGVIAGAASNSTFRNITVINPTSNHTATFGALIGTNEGGCTFDNVFCHDSDNSHNYPAFAKNSPTTGNYGMVFALDVKDPDLKISTTAAKTYNGLPLFKSGTQIQFTNSVSKQGYTCRYVISDANTTISNDCKFTMPATNVTLSTNWTINTYNISYNLDGGSADGAPGTYTVETADIALPTPARPGYTFIGWTGTDLADNTYTVKIPKGSTGNRSYTACWVKGGTADNPFEIASAEDMAAFAKYVNIGATTMNAKVTRNIDFATWSASNAWTMINNFAGTLDGQGYTVSNFNKGRDLWNQQPFFSSIVAGGTVKNLTFSLCSASVFGSSALIAQTNNGIIQGITLFGAWIQGRDNNTAGIASNNGGTITDCAVLQSTFKKRFSGVNVKTEAAICGYSNANGVISNCLSIQNNYVEPGLGDATEGSSSIVVRNSGKVTNCFTDTYLHKDSLTNLATLITRDQLKSGYVAHALQNSRTSAVWGQILGTDTVPSLTSNAAAQVYAIAYKRVTPIETVDYSNCYINGQSSLNLPTAEQLAGDSYTSLIDFSMTYKATYADGTTKEVTSESKTDGDMTVSCMLTPTSIRLSGEGTASAPYLIDTADELAAFTGWVNLKTTDACGKVTKDIDFSSYNKVWNMMFNFAGTLDGDGHTLLNFNRGNISTWNPLAQNVAGGGVVKNLKFDNARVIIQGNDGSAIVVRRNGGTVQGVSVANSLVQCGNFNNLAAIVSYNTGMITDCSVTGTTIQHIWSGTNTKTLAGICGKSSGTISNCYVANNTYSNGVGGSSSFVVTNIGTVTNCYTDTLVLPKDSTTKTATLLTAEQMKGGYLTRALQASRDTAVWGQNLGSDVLPQLTSVDSAQVYLVKYLKGSTAFDSLYVNRYDTLALPTVEPIVGSNYNKLITYNTTFTNSDGTVVSQSTKVTADMQIACAATANGLKMNGTGTTAEPYLIGTAEELAAFRDYVNLGNTDISGSLTDDIDLSTVCGESIGSWEPIGNWDIDSMMGPIYSGTFNGNNKSVKGLYIRKRKAYYGFFGYNKGHITNLHLEGYIDDSKSRIGGIAGSNGDSGIISNSSYSGEINCGNSGGGITGENYGKIINCWCDAKIVGISGIGGIAGYAQSEVSNCLFTGTIEGDKNVNSIVGNLQDSAPVTNCYYLNGTDSKAAQVTAEQLKSGYVAHALQNGDSTNVWGQILGTDTVPRLTAADSAQVYLVQFLKNNVAFDTLFVNRYNKFNLPTIQELAGDGYDAEYIYNVSYNTTDGDNEEVAVTADTQVLADMKVNCVLNVGINLNGDGTTENPCLLSTAEDLVKFRNFVNNVRGDVSAKLTKDIDLVSVYGEGTGSWKAIENYNGTFDGAHHTINIGKHEYQDYPGLFGVINSNSKITNLHVEGIITDSISGNDYNGLGGIANMMVGGLVSNCSFSGKLNCAGLAGGIVGNVTKGGKITDCWSDADVYAGEMSGGIAGAFNYPSASDNKDNIISNCLFLGTDSSGWAYDPIIYSFNDDDRRDGTVDNCYYINSDFSASGELVTVEQLKSGYVLGKLGSAWAQTLGEDTIPTPCKESKKGSTNYIYHDTDGWACDDFHVTDGTALPIGLEFLAKKLTNNRTFNEGYYTVCLPYDLSVPVNTTYSEFSNVDEAHTTVNFTTGSGDVLSAYQPYMLKVTDKSANLSGENITVKAQPTETSSAAFVGTVTGLTNEEAANAGAYILQSDNYWHPVKAGNTNATIPAYRAYLVLPSASAAKSYRFVVDGVSTGISSVNTESSIISGAVYDLQGRKIANDYEEVRNSLPAGIYVVNGKKIVKK